jgi:hypothetical protein
MAIEPGATPAQQARREAALAEVGVEELDGDVAVQAIAPEGLPGRVGAVEVGMDVECVDDRRFTVLDEVGAGAGLPRGEAHVPRAGAGDDGQRTGGGREQGSGGRLFHF